MMISDRKIQIKAGRESYWVIFADLRRELKKCLEDKSKIVVISNPTVFALHGKKFIKDLLPPKSRVMPLMIGDGERYKTQRTANLLYDQLFNIGLGRRDTIVAFGGGVVGDVAGFVAATYMRGVNLIHAPTTILAMVDSSIGGKTAVNHGMGKNLIGTFYQPRAVIVNPEWLATLEQREIINGMAEIVKAGFLSSEALTKEAAERAPVYITDDRTKLLPLIRSAIKFKAEVVARDVLDFGLRAILNFGHTFAHAIEKAEGFRKYRHGEAVLAGMAGALYLSHLTDRLSKTRLNKYLKYLTPFMNRLKPLKKDAKDYLLPMEVDKKSRQGHMVFVLLSGIGNPSVRKVRSQSKVIESIELMKAFVNNRGKM